MPQEHLLLEKTEYIMNSNSAPVTLYCSVTTTNPQPEICQHLSVYCQLLGSESVYCLKVQCVELDLKITQCYYVLDCISGNLSFCN